MKASTSKLKSTSTHRALIGAALLVLPLVWFYPAFTGSSSLAPGDGWFQNFGVRVLTGRLLDSGFLPLWNPYIFGGLPLLASTYPGALYPPNWLFALFSPGVAMKVVVITTYHLALLGTYLYLRRVGLSRLAALAGGLSFTFSGFMIAHLGHTSRIAAAAWLPWMMLAMEQLYQRISWRWVVIGSFFFALQFLAGEPQMLVYTALVAGAYVLFAMLFRPATAPRWQLLAAAATMIVCGTLLAAINWIPSRELVQQSGRAKLTYEYFSAFSMPPRQVVSLIFPYFFGGAVSRPYILAPWGPSDWGADNVAVSCGYVGMFALLLALVAICGSQRWRLVWFWGFIAALSLTLAFGAYLPFGLNGLLYRLPVYNLFRGSYRHLLEFDFAVSALAGFGLHYLAQMDQASVRRALTRAAASLGLLVTVTAIVYCFFWPHLLTNKPRQPQFGSLTNAEALIPISFFLLSVMTAWFYARRRSRLAGALLIGLLLADLAAFGHAFEWRNAAFDANAQLSDPPAVRAIKARETDLNSFRILSHGAMPFVENYDALDFPNVSIARGLQSVNGYDVLQLRRFAAVAGEMTAEGAVQDSSAFDPQHQGFNLLNVKYLLNERRVPVDEFHGDKIDGVVFSRAPLSLRLRPGTHVEMALNGVTATELAVISSLSNAAALTNGTPVASVRLHTSDGRVIERELQAGRDTAEWAWDRADVTSVIRHQRAAAAQSWDAGGFAGHRYLARLRFDRAEIVSVEFDFRETGSVELSLERASLFDAQSQTSTPLDSRTLPASRWRKLAQFDTVDLYENIRALPRAWFVREVQARPAAEVLQAIKTGRLTDQQPFDPAQTALLETEDFGARAITLPATGPVSEAQVSVTKYEPQRIELVTRNAQPGFLVLSEIYYRGWEAWIDGQRVPVERVNHVLRGVSVAPGSHRIEFVFRSPGFRNGIRYSLLSLLVLLTGAVISQTGWPRRPGLQSAAKFRFRVRGSKWWLGGVVVALTLYGATLIRQASYAVGGSDSSGYASVARALLSDHLVQEVAPLRQLGLPAEFAPYFIPLGHAPGPRPGTMSSFYPVGWPLHLAAAATLAGWKNGPFIVSPLLAVLCLVLMYLVGIELGLSRGLAATGSFLLAVCPVFVYLALQPMSDIAATFWSLLAVLAALRSGRQQPWAVVAGAAFGVAFLVRPTNVLLLAPLLLSLRLKPRTLLYFLLGGAPLALVFLIYNQAAYGHPLRTGYGAIQLQDAIALHYFPARFRHYVYWLAMMMSPLPLVGWLLTAFNRRIEWRRRALLIGWFAAFFLFYCCYEIYNEWWYTRFLLPGIPALIIGLLLTAQTLAANVADRLTSERRRQAWRAAVICVLLIIPAIFAQQILRRFAILSLGATDYVHARSCRWADRQLPAQALVVSMEMSGALKFYTGRPIARWDYLLPEQWTIISRHAAERNVRCYALLMPQEIAAAQQHLPGRWRQLGQYQQISLWQIEQQP